VKNDGVWKKGEQRMLPLGGMVVPWEGAGAARRIDTEVAVSAGAERRETREHRRGCLCHNMRAVDRAG